MSAVDKQAEVEPVSAFGKLGRLFRGGAQKKDDYDDQVDIPRIDEGGQQQGSEGATIHVLPEKTELDIELAEVSVVEASAKEAKDNGENVESVKDPDDMDLNADDETKAMDASLQTERTRNAELVMTTSFLQRRFSATEIVERNPGKKLGTIAGVFFPCLQNILGVILFLRLPWIVGVAGWLQAFGCVALCCTCTFLTSLSQCAIATNGKVPGGGSYYMISRALGPAAGGAVGILFYLGTTVASVMYTLGAIEVLVKGVDGFTLNSSEWLDMTVFGTILMASMVALVYVGVKYVAIVGPVFLAIVVLCVLFIYIGIWSLGARDVENIPGISADQFDSNRGAEYPPDENFTTMLALFFPSVTGIMAGSNRSGDLQNPQHSIPRGTIAAQLTTSVIYLSMVLFFGASANRETLTDLEDLFVAKVSWPIGVIVQVGVCLSTIGAGLQSLTGAPRVLNAIAQDQTMPILRIFATTSGEPRRALFFTWFIAGSLVWFGDLNAVTPIITMFFLMCYAFVNFATFLLTFLGAPNFRPRWRFYHWSTALLGFLTCLAIMFLISWLYALIAFALSAGIYRYIQYKGQVNDWGDGLRGLRFQNARNNLLDLEDMGEQGHTKNWRPHILAMAKLDVDGHEFRPHHDKLWSLLSQMSLGGGLTIVSTVLEGTFLARGGQRDQAKETLRTAMKVRGVRGFAEAITAESWSQGFINLLQSAGLGQMVPNMFLVTWPTSWRKNELMPKQFMRCLTACIQASKSFLVFRNIEMLTDENVPKTSTIDVWWLLFDGGLTVLFPFLLKKHRVWRNCTLRIFAVAPTSEMDQLRAELEQLLYDIRIEAVVKILDMDSESISLFTHQNTLTEVDGAELKQSLAKQLGRASLSAQPPPQSPPTSATGGTDSLNETNGSSDGEGTPPSPTRTKSFERLQRKGSFNATNYFQHDPAALNTRMRQHSTTASLVVLSLPIPSDKQTHHNYMAYLETMTEGLPATLLLSCPEDVITIYS